MIFPRRPEPCAIPTTSTSSGGKVRDGLGAPDVTTHSFRKSLATLIDDEGLSARIGADQLGHTNVSMTQDKYMSRGRVHTQVADLLDRLVGESDGQTPRIDFARSLLTSVCISYSTKIRFAYSRSGHGAESQHSDTARARAGTDEDHPTTRRRRDLRPSAGSVGPTQ